MLSPKDFVANWGKDGQLIRYGKKALEALKLADEDKVFLARAGLPESAAPFLTFQIEESRKLSTVADQWKLPDEFRRYRTIGFDGGGNPIALDEKRHGNVVYLDHENKFARVLMNKSVRQLAESLLAYRKMGEDAIAINGEDAFLDGNIPKASRDALKRELKTIDRAAVRPGCFWHDELKNLDANARQWAINNGH